MEFLEYNLIIYNILSQTGVFFGYFNLIISTTINNNSKMVFSRYFDPTVERGEKK